MAQKHIGDISHKLSALFGEHAESAHLCDQRAIFMRKLMYEMQTLQEPDFDGWGEVSKSWARYWGGVYINPFPTLIPLYGISILRGSRIEILH